LEALLGDEQSTVRMALLEGGSVDPALLARIYERLAADEDPKVLNAVAAVLFANPHTDFEDVRRWRDLLEGALRTPEGARIAFDAGVRGPRKAELQPLLLAATRWTTPNAGDVQIQDVLPASEV